MDGSTLLDPPPSAQRTRRRLSSLRWKLFFTMPAAVLATTLAYEWLHSGSPSFTQPGRLSYLLGLVAFVSIALLALVEQCLLRPLKRLAAGLEARETTPAPLDPAPDMPEEQLTGELDRIRNVMFRAQDSLWQQDQDMQRLQRELALQREALDTAQALLHEQELELASLSRSDALTGLFNKNAFDEVLRREFKRAQRQRSLLSVAVLDLDQFKRFNQAHGTQSGDIALQQVAELLTERFKRDTDVVARLGGEEFVVLLPGAGMADAQGVLELVREDVRNLRLPPASGEAARLTVSIGLAGMSPSHPYLSAQALLQAADEALYLAKHAGRDRLTPAA